MHVTQRIGEFIRDHLKECQPNFFSCESYAIAKLKKVKENLSLVLMGDKDISITDKKCNYFYIRYDGKKTYSQKPASQQYSSCEVVNQVSVPLKIVFVVKCVSPSSLEAWAATTLASMSFMDFKGCESPCINLKSSCYDFNEIVTEEYAIEHLKQFSNSIKLVSINFNLTYDLCGSTCKKGGEPCGDSIDLSKAIC